MAIERDGAKWCECSAETPAGLIGDEAYCNVCDEQVRPRVENKIIRGLGAFREGNGGTGDAGYCPLCERDMPEGPDVCLGTLAGVDFACCGHGQHTLDGRDLAYVTFAPRRCESVWVSESMCVEIMATRFFLRRPGPVLFQERRCWSEG